MNKEINYPIKYAVLELKEKGGWLVGYEDITQGFIVSKCYVVGSNIVYHPDGTNTINHQVVFPFEDISLFKASIGNGGQNIGDGKIPHYDACNKPYSVHVVSDLFDTYEQAKEAAFEKNEEYKQNIIFKMPVPKGDTSNSVWDERFKSLIREYEENLELCNKFEQLVLEATENMSISEGLSMNSNRSIVRILKPTIYKRKDE